MRDTAPTVALKPKSKNESDQVCEPATSVPWGFLVELDKEDWLIDWDNEVWLLPLHSPEASMLLSHLVLSSTKTVSWPCIDIELSPLIPPTQPSFPTLSSRSSQSFTPASVGSLQPLIFSPDIVLCGETSGPLVAKFARARGSQSSDFSFWAIHSTSASRPALPSLLHFVHYHCVFKSLILVHSFVWYCLCNALSFDSLLFVQCEFNKMV